MQLHSSHKLTHHQISPPAMAITPRSQFKGALEFTLQHEGGISWDSRDPGNRGGNATAYGVTQPVYNTWRSTNDLSPRSVTQISKEEIKQLYKELYYDKIYGDALPPALATVLFDSSVNLGTTQTIKILQKSLGITSDGIWGRKTMEAIRNTIFSTNKTSRLTIDLLIRRRSFYQRLAKDSRYKVFLNGWLNRVNELQKKIQLT